MEHNLYGKKQKEANIQCHSLHGSKRWEWGRSLPWQHFCYADDRCLCPGHWTEVSAVSLPLHETNKEEKTRTVASKGQNSATHTKFNSFSLPNFPHSISHGTGLYPHFLKSLLSSTPPIYISMDAILNWHVWLAEADMVAFDITGAKGQHGRRNGCVHSHPSMFQSL